MKIIQAGAKHRGAALWMFDDTVRIEAEAISTVLASSATRFATLVRAAVFFYSTAPDTSFGKEENLKPEAGRAAQPFKAPGEDIDETDELRPMQPGYRDITFPASRTRRNGFCRFRVAYP